MIRFKIVSPQTPQDAACEIAGFNASFIIDFITLYRYLFCSFYFVHDKNRWCHFER